MSASRILRYIFFVSLTIWVLVSIPIFYHYVRSSSQEVVNKGGTFIEGIFKNTSYLPYLSNDAQSLFYQGLLFRSCLDYSINEDGSLAYDNNLCKVDTNDYKTYYVKLIPDNTWSDGVPISLDDIYFTYQNIIVDNPFKLPHLDENSEIIITKETNKLKIVFPRANRDNNVFFTNYILPQHALLNPNIDMYQQSFALEPVYNTCAKIYSQSTDQYSLVFDLTKCEDTNLGFYQIKNLQGFNVFEKTIKKDGTSIVDAYEDNTILSGYTKQAIHTDKYMLLFLNTKSPKLLVRTRRALGGLIAKELKKAKKLKFFDSYNNKLFSTYLSDGKNIKEFLDIAITQSETNFKSIKDSGIKTIPTKIAIKGTNQALSYYATNKNQKDIAFSLSNSFDKIGVQFGDDNTLYYPKSFNAKKKTFTYRIGKKQENIDNGMNSYIIYGFTKKKKIKVASIKLYIVENEEESSENATEKIRIIYYKNTINEYTIDILKRIFARNDISSYFVFEGFSDENKLHGVLENGGYDLFVGSINSSLKKVFYSFLNTNKAILNPSKYVNSKMSSLLEQYNRNTSPTILKEINAIYGKDLPFIVLGQEQKFLGIKPTTLDKLTTKKNLHEYNWRNMIYKHLILTKNIYIDSKGLLNLKNFYSYITK